MAWNTLRVGISTASQTSLCYPIILASRGVLSSGSFRPALCEQTDRSSGRVGGGGFRLESRKGWLQRSPPERHTLFCLEFKQCNPSFRISLSKVTGGVDICIDFWPSYFTAIRCRCVSQLMQNAFTYFFLSLTLVCAVLRMKGINLCPGSGIKSLLSPSCSGFLLHNRARDKKASEAPSMHVP